MLVPMESHAPVELLSASERTGLWNPRYACRDGRSGHGSSAAQLAALFSASPAAFLVSIAIVALTFAAISLFTTIPVVVATLRAGRIWLALPTLLLLDLAIALGTIAIFAAVAPQGPSLRRQDYVSLASMAGAFFVCLTGVMLVVRRLGLELFWGHCEQESCR